MYCSVKFFVPRRTVGLPLPGPPLPAPVVVGPPPPLPPTPSPPQAVSPRQTQKTAKTAHIFLYMSAVSSCSPVGGKGHVYQFGRTRGRAPPPWTPVGSQPRGRWSSPDNTRSTSSSAVSPSGTQA